MGRKFRKWIEHPSRFVRDMGSPVLRRWAGPALVKAGEGLGRWQGRNRSPARAELAGRGEAGRSSEVPRGNGARRTAEAQDIVDVLRTAPSPRYPVRRLLAQRCIACRCGDLSVQRYPLFVSRFFAGRILLSCPECGLAWEPSEQLDLSVYYEKHYATEFRADRKYTGRFHSPENPFWQRGKHPIIQRARAHRAIVNERGKVGRIMDIGAGEGVFLSLVDADEKYAQEYDENGRRILQEELGVILADVAGYESYFDAIVASHVVEHFTHDDVEEQLSSMHEALKPGGLLVVDVPQGAAQLEKFAQGERPVRQRLEPHTLFFSSVALNRLLERAGFEVGKTSICKWTEDHLPDYASRVERGGVELVSSRYILSAVTKPTQQG